MENKWIDLFGQYAQKYAKQYGYKVCSPAIAQFIQESSGKYDGLSYLAYKYNNFHGIKDYPKWHGKTINMKTGEEYVKGTISTVNSNFCVFDSQETGWQEYYLFLERNPRYKNLKACTTAESYLATIKADGYCTSSDYVNKCVSHLNTYNLKRFDDFETETTTYAVGNTYTLQVNLNVRSEPMGEKMKFDCITQNAKEHAHYDEYGNAILDKGTKVSCLDIKELVDSTWLLIPSGWICGKISGKVYVL